MRQLKRHVKKSGLLRPSAEKYRNVIPIGAAAAVAVLVAYFLSGSHAAPLYASPEAGSGALRASLSGNTCTHPTVIQMDPNNAQSGLSEHNYYVTNDSWNASSYGDLSQALYVCNYNSWYAIATMNNNTGDGAVKTSPNVQETWYPTPTKLSGWKSITSHFSDVPPGTGPSYGTWEFEYDIWLNGIADSNSTEIMIWTYNNGRTPSGSPVGSFTDAGHTYVVYRSAPPNRYVAFVDLNADLSGNINLLHFFNYVISKGWMPSSSTLYQVCNGIELVSTNNKAERFTINDFSINMEPYP